MIIYTTDPILMSNNWAFGRLVPSTTYPGKWLILTPNNGRVVSMQPSGNIEYRDPGVDGGYEQATKIGEDLLLYTPMGLDGTPWPIGFREVEGL